MDHTVDDDRKQQDDLNAAVAVEAAPQEARGQTAVLANLHTLGPGDSDLLAQRLKDFPELHDQILEWAVTHLGNATVHAALAALDKGAAKEGAEHATDDAFVKDQIEVMATQKSDEEFVAFEMGVMAAEKKDDPDTEFVAEQMEQMTQAKSDEEFVAYQMGVMTQDAKDDQFVKEQIEGMQQQQSDEAFVAEQMGVMAQGQDDAAFAEGQIEEMAKQQSDEEFARYQIGIMEAEQHQAGKAEHEAEAPKKATAEEHTDKQLVEHVAKAPDVEPEILGAALAEHPELRQPLVEEATQAHGAEVVQQAVEVEQHEAKHEAQPAAPAEVAAVEAQPTVIEEPTKSSEREEAWAVGAREYNEEHAELVARFNELTDNVYAPPDGRIAVEVIVAWQQANGVAVDGRIGPETVAAAKGAKKVTIADAAKARVVDAEELPADDEQP